MGGRIGPLVACAGLSVMGLAGCGMSGSSHSAKVSRAAQVPRRSTTTSSTLNTTTSTTTLATTTLPILPPADATTTPTVIPPPEETTTTEFLCSGELSSTISIASAFGGGYTVSGTVANGRTDAVNDVQVWFGTTTLVGDYANVDAGSIPPSGLASWSKFENGVATQSDQGYVTSITYQDEAQGEDCTLPGFGGRSP